MNRKSINRRFLYYPAVFYVGLLLLVWLLSWLGSVAELALGKSLVTQSLLSASGIRWAVRTALHTIDAAPWAVIMLAISSVGLLTGSGIVKSGKKLLAGGKLALNESRAWLFACLAVVLYVLALFVCTLSPWNLLLGVTDDIYASPLAQGYIIICFMGVSLVATSFGFIYGNYRSLIDIARSVGGAFSLFAPALVSVLPATGIMPCVEFAGLLSVLHIEQADAAVVSDVLYLLPFVYVLIVLRKSDAV